MQHSFPLPSLFFFLGRISWEKDGAGAIREVHVSKSDGRMFPSHPYPGICPSHGNQAALPAKPGGFHKSSDFFCRELVRLPQKYAVIQINGGSERLPKPGVSWAVFLRGFAPLLCPSSPCPKTDGHRASIAVSPKTYPGESRTWPRASPPSPKPQPGSRFPRAGKPPHRQNPSPGCGRLLPHPNNEFFLSNRASADHNLGTAD